MDVRVWVGCLAHYNDGELIGDWVNATDASDWQCPRKNPDDIYTNCEETWCFDHEIPGVEGELAPGTAAEWGARFAELSDDEAEPYGIWLDIAGHIFPDNATVEAFRDVYMGSHDSEKDFAYHLLEDSGMFDGWPEAAKTYFDWDSYARDLFIDGYTFDKGHVFADR